MLEEINRRSNGSITRRLVALITLLVMASPLPAPAATAATSQEVADEWSFVALANRERAAVGRPPLQVVPGLLAYARSHSTAMLAAGRIFHDSAQAIEAEAVTSCWIKIGENVGKGPSVTSIHAALMASPSHRRNILDDFTYVGFGVRRSSTGLIYVTERFMKLRPGCTLPTIPPPSTSGYPSALSAGAVLGPNKMLMSPSGSYVLKMQFDGNLVLRVRSTGRVVWATGTDGHPGTVLMMQRDGNLVLRAPGNRPIWASGTDGRPGTVLQLQDDGNLVLYAPGHRAIWDVK